MKTPYIGQKVRALDGRLKKIKGNRIGEIIDLLDSSHPVTVKFENDALLTFTTDGKEYAWEDNIDIEFLEDGEFLQDSKDSLLIEIL